jgi:osmotically-inducible protein OsmY
MNGLLKRCSPLLLTPLLLAGACNKDTTMSDTQLMKSRPAQAPAGVAADDTKMNVRDRGSTMTPVDQSNAPEDLNTTAQIRKALMADDSLSTTAKNAKVITANGVVLLRGAVKTPEERSALEQKAAQLAGPNRVENQLDVVASQ